jgi:DNA primase
MAVKKTTQAKAANLLPQQIKKIWKDISISNWIALLSEFKPNNNWVQASETTIKGQCPYHDDNDPSFVIDVSFGNGHCWGCGKRIWDPLKFVADISAKSYTEALRELRNRFSLRLPAAYIQNAQMLADHADMKLALFQASNLELREAIASPDKPEFEYIKKAGLLEWLGKRKLPGLTIPEPGTEDSLDGAVHLWPVGVLMPQHRLFTRLGERKEWVNFQNAAYTYTKDWIADDKSTCGSLLFFYFSSPTTVGRLRVRIPETKDIYAIEDVLEPTFGIFGLNMLAGMTGEISAHKALVVEGEFDALSIISHQLARGNDSIIPVATGGGMDVDMSLLLSFGVEVLSAGPDNDAAGIGWGRRLISVNPAIKTVFDWNSEDSKLAVKDIDAAFRSYGFDTFYERLINPDTYLFTYAWLQAELSIVLADTPLADIKTKVEMAAQWATSLKNDAERKLFIDGICSTFQLDPKLIVQHAIPDDDSTDAFVGRLYLRLQEEYQPLYSEQKGGTNAVTCWAKKKGLIRNFMHNSSGQTRTAMEMDLGGLEKFVKEEMGEPMFMQYKADAKGNPTVVTPQIKDQLITLCFSRVTSQLIAEAPPRERLQEKAQGIHYLKDAQAVLIINGNKFYAGEHHGSSIKYRELECPVFNDYLLQPRGDRWSKFLKSADDLKPMRDYDIKKTYETLVSLLQDSWRFQNQELEPRFLAAHLMYTPMGEVFGNMVLTAISSRGSQAGKTTLLQILGGTEFGELRLCESSLIMDGYTEASVRQQMNGCSLWLLLDEFEDEDRGMSAHTSRQAQVVRGILELIRSLSSGSTVYRGSTGGTARAFNVYFPLTVCGMHPLKSAPDVNRFVDIRLKSVAGLQNPADVIRKKFTADEISRLRRHVTFGLLQHIPEIQAAYKSVWSEFIDNASLTANMQGRLKENLLPAATIMKLAGQDYARFLREYGELKMGEMNEVGAFAQESVQIWNELLQSPIHIPATDTSCATIASVSKMLTKPSLRTTLEDMDLGVYSLPRQQWLIVYWQKAIAGVLRHSPTYRNAQFAGSLKQAADMDKRVIPKEVLSQMSFLQNEVWPRTGMRLTYDDFSVINIGDTIILGHAMADDAVAASDKQVMQSVDPANLKIVEDLN